MVILIAVLLKAKTIRDKQFCWNFITMTMLSSSIFLWDNERCWNCFKLLSWGHFDLWPVNIANIPIRFSQKKTLVFNYEFIKTFYRDCFKYLNFEINQKYLKMSKIIMRVSFDMRLELPFLVRLSLSIQ